MTLRIAIALLAAVSAGLAYPWQTEAERWTAGVAVVVLVVVLAWWRGLFVTTMVARRIGIAHRNLSTPAPRAAARVTQLLRVDDPRGVGLPAALVARYVDRFGVRCCRARITSHQTGDGMRTTWIGLTVDANDNLAALRARSARLPLRDMAEIVGRRLADQLREMGLEASVVDEGGQPLHGRGRERWTSVHDDLGAVSAYRVRVDDGLPERLAELWALPGDVWVTLEFGASGAGQTLAAVCAIRGDAQAAPAPAGGLTALRGVQRPVLSAVDPTSTDALGVDAAVVSVALLDRVSWPILLANSAMA